MEAGKMQLDPPRALPAGLSERELQVLLALAHGGSNREIAAELGISAKTVGHHVQSVYAKAGVRNRAAATRWAFEQDLVRGGRPDRVSRRRLRAVRPRAAVVDPRFAVHYSGQNEPMPGTHSNANGGRTPRALAIYLKDHHAAGSAGVRLAARIAENISPAVEARSELARVAQEVQEDLHTLERVMLAEQVCPNATKDTLAKGVELLGRFKLNGRVTGRAPLSDVIELETLLIGITGK